MSLLPAVAQNVLLGLVSVGCTPLLLAQARTATPPLFALPGTVHPLATAAADRGAVDASEPTGRILVLLNRPAASEAALKQYLRDASTPGSTLYHHWLTPAEIGARFGPAAADKAAVDAWLGASGLQIAKHSKSGLLVEFSGTIGQLNETFHTSIHQYAINAEIHRANATALQIPQSLSSIVAAVSPLNDLHAVSYLKTGGSAHYDAVTRKIQPELTLPYPSRTIYVLTPADFATQYDLGPLTTAGTNGSGTTIGIISESDIDLGLSNAFRTIFGLPANPVQVVLDGTDPGENSAATEAYLDVERAGGTAPNATINLYTAETYSIQNPLLLAANRAIDDNQADVLSVSYGEDEMFLGASGNAIWNDLWEQAAAQGETVLVATGDTGATDPYGLVSVSGLASTPWNIAVGGTDFYYADYATGAPSAATFWSATNDPVTKGSLLAPLTEQVWNDAFGLDALSFGAADGYFYAGGGGASSCVFGQTATANCTTGYPKPAWQAGTGVPADGVRDIPDLALFAANGFNYSYYAVCAEATDCAPDSNGNFNLTLAGGTSASAPSMAGIMALVTQKYGRQGQADPTLYALAKQKPAAFHDITIGSNENVCPGGTLDCAANNKTTVYVATPGYDPASGLGSVDATVLVNNWNSVTYASTETTLTASATKAVHGQPVTLTTTVTGASGTPTGLVGITTNSSLPASQGLSQIVLSDGTGSDTSTWLPGGSYQLTGRYSGDSTFASSSSSPVLIDITPEPSSVQLTLQPTNANGPTTYSYGGPTYLSAEVVNAKGTWDGSATGVVSFTLDSATSSAVLNSTGVASDWPVFSVGSHTASAAYTGDPSYAASQAAPISFSVQKGYASLNLQYIVPDIDDEAPTIPVGGTLYLGMTASGNYGAAAPGTLAPTGSVVIQLVTYSSFRCGDAGLVPSYSTTVQLVPVSGQYSIYSTATATIPNLAAGYYFACALYSGDQNWASGVLGVSSSLSVVGAQPLPTTTVLNITPTTLAGSDLTTLTATVNGLPANGPAPTGYISFFDNGYELEYAYNVAQTGAQSYVQFQLAVASFLANGANQMTAVYSGDQNYQSSTSNTVTLTISQPVDFTLTPAATSLALNAGSSGSVGIVLASVGNLSGTVSMTCATSSPAITCSFSPAAASLPGPSTATLNVTASAPTTAGLRTPPGSRDLATAAALALLAFCILPRRRRMASLACVLLLASLGLASGCGGNTSTHAATTSLANYSVTVTGTAGNVIHTAKIAVAVTTTTQ